MAEPRQRQKQPDQATEEDYASVIDSESAAEYVWKLKPRMVLYIGLSHIFAIVGVVLICLHQHWWRLALEVLIYYQMGAIGITAGAHRLWSHKSYKARSPLRFILMILTSVAHQGSIYHWARDHRIHHKFSETDADPHNAVRGMFFSHVGWLLVEKHPEVVQRGNDLDLSDLDADWVVRLQRKYYTWLSLFFCYILPGLYTHYMYGDYWIGVFTLGFLRHVLTLHATWFVNSIAHSYGMRPYDPKIRPAENILTSLVSCGEGWHNWHHSYPFDYAASEYGVLGSFNPTKFFIDAFSMIGLVSGRRRATHLWEKKKQRLAAPGAEY